MAAIWSGDRLKASARMPMASSGLPAMKDVAFSIAPSTASTVSAFAPAPGGRRNLPQILQSAAKASLRVRRPDAESRIVSKSAGEGLMGSSCQTTG
tara:strand:- start:32682 stop:32969 length:288 start_codon:yes stop_codon:yes gene_type:complete